jgi:molybdenum-dependent DNA-binding transcriptional regulator ModE
MLRSKLEGSNRDLLRDILAAKSIFGRSFDLQMSYRKIYTMLD